MKKTNPRCAVNSVRTATLNVPKMFACLGPNGEQLPQYAGSNVYAQYLQRGGRDNSYLRNSLYAYDFFELPQFYVNQNAQFTGYNLRSAQCAQIPCWGQGGYAYDIALDGSRCSQVRPVRRHPELDFVCQTPPTHFGTIPTWPNPATSTNHPQQQGQADCVDGSQARLLVAATKLSQLLNDTSRDSLAAKDQFFRKMTEAVLANLEFLAQPVRRPPSAAIRTGAAGIPRH